MLLNFLIGLMTVVLVLDCLFLLLLILIQLPKKEAGLGQAFGSGTTDALFGAGSGTALTKMTKYAAVIFFVLTFLLAILNAQQSKERRGGRLREAIEKAAKAAAAQPGTPTSATNVPVKPTPPAPALNLTNLLAVPTNAVASTNKPAAQPTPRFLTNLNLSGAYTNIASTLVMTNVKPAPATNKPAAPPPK